MNALRLRLTACGVTALLVLLVPLAAAEGEYWKEPDTITFPGGGSVAAGRVENLLEQDGRTLKLSDTGDGQPRSGTYPGVVRPTYVDLDDDWGAQGACIDSAWSEYRCIDEVNQDGNTTYLDAATNGSAESVLLCSFKTCGVERSVDTFTGSVQFQFHIRANVSGNPDTRLLVLVYSYDPTIFSGPGSYPDTSGFLCGLRIVETFSVAWSSLLIGLPGVPQCRDTARMYRALFILDCTTAPCDRLVSLTAASIHATFTRGNSASFGVTSVPYYYSSGTFAAGGECSGIADPWECVDNAAYEHDGDKGYIGAAGCASGCTALFSMGDIDANATGANIAPLGLTAHVVLRSLSQFPDSLNVSLIWTNGTATISCLSGTLDNQWFIDHYGGPFASTYPYNWTSFPSVDFPPASNWDISIGNTTCAPYIAQAGGFILNLTEVRNTVPQVLYTSVSISAMYSDVVYRLGADLSLGATGYYPIRAEWTCTARTGGPYYLGALNATGGTRWLNVTRDASNASYPSGEMCAVPGATERYHAAMTAADFGADGRVHFRIADNASDPSGSAWGNITLDRLVAILTQDFAVSVGNLGWLVYLGFLTVGILIAAFAYHRWREHGSGA